MVGSCHGDEGEQLGSGGYGVEVKFTSANLTEKTENPALVLAGLI
jgi:hypothetical protein